MELLRAYFFVLFTGIHRYFSNTILKTTTLIQKNVLHLCFNYTSLSTENGTPINLILFGFTYGVLLIKVSVKFLVLFSIYTYNVSRAVIFF